jgi:hypothetical protein
MSGEFVEIRVGLTKLDLRHLTSIARNCNLHIDFRNSRIAP